MGAPYVNGAGGLDDALCGEIDVTIVVEQDACVAAPLRPTLLSLVGHVRVNACAIGVMDWASCWAHSQHTTANVSSYKRAKLNYSQ